MGLMDKFKNLFTDEEIIEEETIEPVEIKEVKKEEINQLPTFMREKLKEEKEEQEQEEIKFHNFNLNMDEKESYERPEPKIDIYKEPEEKNKFKFPMDLTDDDFIETRQRSRQPKELNDALVKKMENEPQKTANLTKGEVKVADLYKDKKEIQKEEKKKFKATPIISPIYGVLDKNYSPVDVECNVGENFETRRPSKNVDFDSVRKKAYGSLSEEIKENLLCENCEYLKEAKECRKTKSNIEENLVYEAMNNNTSDDCYYSDITLDEATENYYDYGVEYEKSINPNDRYNNQTSNYKEDNYIRLDNSQENKVLNTEKNKEVKSIPPVKSSINLLSTLKKSMGDEAEEKKNLELTDDLFNLIDSMYDERNDS